ncbi:MAG: ABC transporter permease, partial [Lachnospiraceae bacterium]|nr:ABC transporter permease [Lachnospiraceae bacterium]
LDSRSMYDVQIFSRYNNVYEEENLPVEGYGVVSKFLAGQGIETENDCTFHLYLPERSDFHKRMKYDFPAVVISLSDYNAIRSMLGMEAVSLGENEFTTQWRAVATDGERDDFLKSHQTVTTDGGSLALSNQPWHQDNMGQTIYNSYTNVVLVFPDAVCEKLLPVMQNRYIVTSGRISFENARRLAEEFEAAYPEETDTGVSYTIRLSTLQINDAKANNFVLQAAMIYGAVVLMVICLTVLSLQQLLDAGHYRYRFSVLRKLGVEESRIERLMLKQLGVWFGLPVTLAIGVSGVVITYFFRTISAEIAAYIGLASLLQQAGATAGILLLLLICYFISTWILFRRSAG